jgi:hypothetical protein
MALSIAMWWETVGMKKREEVQASKRFSFLNIVLEGAGRIPCGTYIYRPLRLLHDGAISNYPNE